MQEILETLQAITWQQVVMWVLGGVLIWLAIAKDMEPTLLLPMGFGAILVNLPLSGAVGPEGPIDVLYNAGIANELFPLLLFVGIGAMIDFGPLLTNPKLMLFGAAAQFGIFFTLSMATLLGFDLRNAASIAVIGAADGPTATPCSPTTSAPSSWLPTPTWLWCPSCSPPLSSCSPPSPSG